jgi:hypothetical protein
MASAFADKVVPNPECPGAFILRDPVPDRGYRVRESPHARRHAAGDGLAHNQDVRIKTVRASVAAGPARNRVRLVDQEQRAGGTRDTPQRLVVAGFGQYHATIGQHGLRDHAGDVAIRERALKRSTSLNSTIFVPSVRSTNCPMRPGRLAARPSLQ